MLMRIKGVARRTRAHVRLRVPDPRIGTSGPLAGSCRVSSWGDLHGTGGEVKLYSDIFIRLEDAAMSSEQSLALIKTLSGEDAR